MKTKFTYDFTQKIIIGSKRSIAKANRGLNPEYSELCAKLAEHPDFTVVEKVIDPKQNKKTYSKLTFQKMKDYINTQPDAENKLIEFNAVQKVAEVRGAKYPLTKKWFLATYPEYKENEISVAQTKTLIEADALAKAQLALANIELDDEDLLEDEYNEIKEIA